jgi:hypothetical protein
MSTVVARGEAREDRCMRRYGPRGARVGPAVQVRSFGEVIEVWRDRSLVPVRPMWSRRGIERDEYDVRRPGNISRLGVFWSRRPR